MREELRRGQALHYINRERHELLEKAAVVLLDVLRKSEKLVSGEQGLERVKSRQYLCLICLGGDQMPYFLELLRHMPLRFQDFLR